MQRIARAKAVFQATVEENRWIPEHIKAGLFPKQIEFLSFEGREALYGGACGGGKSVSLLAAALQYVDEPSYHALIMRRTHKQLSKADSILAKSKEWLWGKAKWNGDDHMWTFPSGATLEFGHMQTEDAKLNYQGGSWSYIGVDEATQFTEAMLTYPRSRQRRETGSRIPIRWRGASNPGGIGHDSIKKRYVQLPDGSSPCGPDRQFFPATLADNPHIDQAEYIATLKESGIDPITLAQLLRGDWDAVIGGRFKASWLRHYRREPATQWHRFGEQLYTFEDIKERFITCDPAATVKQTAKDDPDWTVISTWGFAPCGYLVWLACKIIRCEIPELPNNVWNEYHRWGAQRAFIEGFGIGKGPAQVCKRHGGHMNIIEYTPKGTGKAKDKLANATNAMNMMEAGRIWLPADNPGFPLDEVESQLLTFTGSDKLDAHDDVVDTLSQAANVIMAREPPRPGRRGIVVARDGRAGL